MQSCGEVGDGFSYIRKIQRYLFREQKLNVELWGAAFQLFKEQKENTLSAARLCFHIHIAKFRTSLQSHLQCKIREAL